MNSSRAIASFADFLTLCYHEARNVRHLARAGLLDRAPYRLVIDGLAEERIQAWKQLQHLRDAAGRATSARKAEEVFGRHFAVSLECLVTLSENRNWKDTRRGGNKWAEINRAVIKLRDAIDQADEELMANLLTNIPLMCHNTGRLDEKLESLDSRLQA